MMKALPNGGKCMGFVGLPGADNARERIEGVKETIKGSKVELVDVRADEIDPSPRQAQRRGHARRQPQHQLHRRLLLLQYAAHLRGAEGSRQARQIKIIGFDEDPITLGGVKEGTIVGTVVQQPL